MFTNHTEQTRSVNGRDRYNNKPLKLCIGMMLGALLFTTAFLQLFVPSRATAAGTGQAGATIPPAPVAFGDEVFWLDINVNQTNDIAWADMDLDGDLDVAVANETEPYIEIYRNNNGDFDKISWTALAVQGRPKSVAWGDANNDGYPDLAVATFNSQSKQDNIIESRPFYVFQNERGRMADVPIWAPAIKDSALDSFAVAWGDFNDDGWLDLVYANRITDGGDPKRPQPGNVVFFNESKDFSDGEIYFPQQSSWTSISSRASNDVAVIDIDDDGDLDIAIANGGMGNPYLSMPNYIYINKSSDSTFDRHFEEMALAEIITEPGNLGKNYSMHSTRSVALGDANGDGRPDLAIGNFTKGDGVGPNYILCNKSEKDEPKFSVCWQSPVDNNQKDYNTQDVAWADINGDKVLDLVVGNDNAPNEIFCNNSPQSPETSQSSLELEQCWTSESSNIVNDQTLAVAPFDADNDGDIDLIVGNGGRSQAQPNYVYINPRKWLTTYGLSLAETPQIQDVQLGDLNRDGRADLLVAIEKTEGFASAVYFLPNSGTDAPFPSDWSKHAITEANGFAAANSLALGDSNHDGFPDLLAVGYGHDKTTKQKARPEPTVIYRIVPSGNDVSFVRIFSTLETYVANSVAFADVDQNGCLDLAIGVEGSDDSGKNMLFTCDTQGDYSLAWTAPEARNTEQVRWGDLDNDGDPDLAVANANAPNQVFLNDNGTLAAAPDWQSPDASYTFDLAWGDYDGDGDLDLATASGLQNRPQISFIFENDRGRLSEEPIWRSVPLPATAVDWQDFDLDGDLDLVLLNSSASGNSVFSHIYPNRGGVIGTESINWGHSNTDGSPSRAVSYSMAWGDLDNNGVPDAVDGQIGQHGHLIFNQRQGTYADPLEPHNLFTSALWISNARQIADGTVEIAFDLVGKAEIEYDIRAFAANYTTQATNDEMWQRITLTSGLDRENASGAGTSHTITFSPIENKIFGQIDNFVVRVVAIPRTHRNVPILPSAYAAPASNSKPFVVRGQRIRVVQEKNNSGSITQSGVKDALVFHAKPCRDGFLPYTSIRNEPFRTDGEGFLQGFGRQSSDTVLFAMLPVTSSETFANYSLYHTSSPVNEQGCPIDEITAGDSQTTTLTVSEENKLYLFDLDLSLEWDARHEPAYLEQLQASIRRASTYLYDVTDGQMALGDVTIYHNKKKWREANVQVYASNRFRPSADLGGIVTEPITIAFGTENNTENNSEADIHLEVASDVYGSDLITNAVYPGQIRMPAYWNRFGEPTLDGGEDWARAFAHELGHYLLFLPDHYLQSTGSPTYALNVDRPPCASHQGSIMHSAYQSLESAELVADFGGGDGQECSRPIGNFIFGKLGTRILSDWELLAAFYEGLTPGDNDGPFAFPLGLSRVKVDGYNPMLTVYADPFFTAEKGSVTEPLSPLTTDAYLFRKVMMPNGSYTNVVALGAPIANQFYARGAQDEDRFCIHASSDKPEIHRRAGCAVVNSPNITVELQNVHWAPTDITLEAQPAKIVGKVLDEKPFIETVALTFTIEITGDGVNKLHLEVLPTYATVRSTGVKYEDLQPHLGNANGNNTFVFSDITLPDIAFRGYLRIWADDQQDQEALIPFVLGGGWAPDRFEWGPDRFEWGPDRFAWGTGVRGWNAPVANQDGAVMLFNIAGALGKAPPYAINQAALGGETLNFTPVGAAYDIALFKRTNNQPSDIDKTGMFSTSIVFQYLERNLPNRVMEAEMKVFHRPVGGSQWISLETSHIPDRNLAAAVLDNVQIQATGNVTRLGTYMLGLQTTIPLTEGWNLIGYPLRQKLSIAELSRILPESVEMIVGDEKTDVGQLSLQWHCREPKDALEGGVPFILSSTPCDPNIQLKELEWARGYWIRAKEATELLLPVDVIGN